MQTQCSRCGAMLPDPGTDFPCPRCGAPVRSAGGGFVTDEEALGPLASVHLSGEPGWKALLRVLQHLARLGSFVLFAVSLALCFAALFWGIPLVLEGAPGSDLYGVLYVLTPAPLGLVEFGGMELVAYHIFLAAAITASLACLLYSERRKLRPLMSESAARFRAPDRQSGLGVVQLPQVFFAIFFFDILFAILVALAGTSPRVPPFETYPDWYLFYTFAHASVYEEFAARTLLVGIPLMLAHIMAHSRLARPAHIAALAGPPVAAQQAPAPVPPAAPPEAAIAPPRRPDALIDATVEDASTRLVPRPGDALAPIASAPAFGAPSESPPPLAPTALPPLPPVARSAPVPQTAAPASPQPSAPEPVSPRPPPPAAPYPALAAPPPLTLRNFLRSRTTNGLLGYILGGGFRIGPLEAFFITGSALMFGYAHVAGWDLWKLLPTFIAGLGFGYLFLKVGIHAAILLHFSFDYLSLGQSLLPGFELMGLLLLVLWTIVGAFYFGHYTVQAVKWLMGQVRPAGGKGMQGTGGT